MELDVPVVELFGKLAVGVPRFVRGQARQHAGRDSERAVAMVTNGDVAQGHALYEDLHLVTTGEGLWEGRVC